GWYQSRTGSLGHSSYRRTGGSKSAPSFWGLARRLFSCWRRRAGLDRVHYVTRRFSTGPREQGSSLLLPSSTDWFSSPSYWCLLRLLAYFLVCFWPSRLLMGRESCRPGQEDLGS